jgi:hypothetical protein
MDRGGLYTTGSFDHRFLPASLDASFQFIKKRMVPIDPKKKERLQRNAPPAPADRFILALMAGDGQSRPSASP